jgi:hypothetical protein
LKSCRDCPFFAVLDGDGFEVDGEWCHRLRHWLPGEVRRYLAGSGFADQDNLPFDPQCPLPKKES